MQLLLHRYNYHKSETRHWIFSRKADPYSLNPIVKLSMVVNQSSQFWALKNNKKTAQTSIPQLLVFNSSYKKNIPINQHITTSCNDKRTKIIFPENRVHYFSHISLVIWISTIVMHTHIHVAARNKNLWISRNYYGIRWMKML